MIKSLTLYLNLFLRTPHKSSAIKSSAIGNLGGGHCLFSKMKKENSSNFIVFIKEHGYVNIPWLI